VKAPAIVRAIRPRQWLKNVLVAAAPLAAGVLLDSGVWLTVLLTFVIFCATSSGIYLLNDLLDAESDRQHPKKKFRPIASGELSKPVALVAAIILLVGAPLVAGYFVSFGLTIVVIVYEIVQISYCVWFKHVVVIDLVLVSSGFLMRAIAGAVSLGIPVSQWFLLVAAFGSLFMVAGKRYSEKLQMEGTGAATRRSLEEYSASYLRFVWAMAAGLALITYSLWAFSMGDMATHLLPAITIIPFSMAILRYAYAIDRGTAGAPEDTVLGDRYLLGLGIIWLVVFGFSVVYR
jgi:decaprenyl-phosphate phosphoribosyltransferase